MRVFAAFVFLGLAFVITRWIRRRHDRQEDPDGVDGEMSGTVRGRLTRPSPGRRIAKAGSDGRERLLATRGIETVGAMAAFVLILFAMYMILRFIVAF